MKLEFDLYKVEDIGKNLEGFIQKGEFIVVGELMVDNEEHFMCHPINHHELNSLCRLLQNQ